MRDIKFRVYDDGRMKYPEEYKENRFDNYFIDLNGQLSYYQNCYDGGFFDTENVKIMQFTGIHDKNGKEIYEGDIVKIDNNVASMFNIKSTGKVEYNNGLFLVRNGDEISILSSLFVLADTKYCLRGEVIGNIYENPELLKGADNIE